MLIFVLGGMVVGMSYGLCRGWELGGQSILL